MEFKRPENFEDILKLQKHLDESIHSSRERTEEDIKTSMIAELIEFNEETKDSHKTWKTKEYNKTNELEELTDVYFFFAQLVNYEFSSCRMLTMKEKLKSFEKNFKNKTTILNVTSNFKRLLNLTINYVTTADTTYIFELLNTLTIYYGYTKDDILNCYWEKWQKNMQRIGKEWN